MSGKYKGCAAVIKRKYPKAKCTQCYSHVLNLAVVKACSLVQVQILFKPGVCRRRPARDWFLKIDPVRIVSMCVCLCVSAPEAINN